MSFDQLSSLEAGRRRGSPGFSDDPEFQRLSQDMMNKLFRLNGNNQRLGGEVAHLGTRRDTPRVRERVHELIEESREMFKEVGEGVKKVQAWEDVTVCCPFTPSSEATTTHPHAKEYEYVHILTLHRRPAHAKIHAAEALA